MRPLTNRKHQDGEYFEAHPWQGTFALTFASMAVVGLIVIAILMTFGG